jgi:hypothetical protein
VEVVLGTRTNWSKKAIADARSELETVSDEIRMRVHLAGMDARTTWDESLEPRVAEARRHAKEATAASKAALDATLEMLRRFAGSL